VLLAGFCFNFFFVGIRVIFHLDWFVVPHDDGQIFAVVGPVVIFTLIYIRKGNAYDLHHAILGNNFITFALFSRAATNQVLRLLFWPLQWHWSSQAGILFSVLITGVLTDAIKDAVGRPRPNFFWRCFPDGKAVYLGLPRVFFSPLLIAHLLTAPLQQLLWYMHVKVFDKITTEVICHHGVPSVVKEGFKSFPSGHTSCESGTTEIWPSLIEFVQLTWQKLPVTMN
jgi:diacylglycerol diphosphate phosphatase / phosphatidate phosphatase